MPVSGPLFAFMTDIWGWVTGGGLAAIAGGIVWVVKNYYEITAARELARKARLEADLAAGKGAPARGSASDRVGVFGDWVKALGWVFGLFVVGIFLFCSGCAGMSCRKAVQPGGGGGGGSGGGEGTGSGGEVGGGTGEVGTKSGQVVPVGWTLDWWAPKLALTLKQVDFRPNGRMRWEFEVSNKTGKALTAFLNPTNGENYLVDQSGTRYDMTGASHSGTMTLPEGQTTSLWVEYQAPGKSATLLTAKFNLEAPHLGYSLPTMGLPLVWAGDVPKLGAPKPAEVFALNRTLASWHPRAELKLVSVEFRHEGSMRWRYELWNRTGEGTKFWINSSNKDNYLIDEGGQRYELLGTSNPYFGEITLPDGQKTTLWVDYQAPPRNAGKVTAKFATEFAHLGYTLPGSAVVLGPTGVTVAP